MIEFTPRSRTVEDAHGVLVNRFCTLVLSTETMFGFPQKFEQSGKWKCGHPAYASAPTDNITLCTFDMGRPLHTRVLKSLGNK